MKNRNKGYSFVELLIVLCMITILSGISLVSLTLLNTARAKQASTLFGDEVNALRKRNVSMTPAEDPANPGKKTAYGLVLHYEDNKFKVTQVECSQTTSGSNTYYMFVKSGSKAKRVDTAEMSSRVEVKFTGYYKSFHDGDDDGGSNRTNFVPKGIDTGNESVCIMFDKHGNCTSGYGKYEFYKSNGNKVATVTVRQNGSIEIR